MKRVLGLHRHTGFSLLEVLIAVVVLSVGLLALAALQGAMTRSSSEAKIRGRVAAMLTARMDNLRNSGYGSLTLGTSTATSTTDGCDGDATDWIDCPREQAALGSLTVQQTIAVWFGGASFASSNVEQDSSIPQFKRVLLTSTWMDAGGTNHTQSITSDVSSMALTNNMIIPPEPLSTPTGGPIVRTVSPATAGVIPIAISTNEDTGEGESFNATTNPTPELVGQTNNQQIVGTRFTVLNYSPSFGSSVVIQKRFDTEVVKCRCKFGAGGSNLPAIYQTEMWPAIWTGEGYQVYDAGGAAAPGDTLNSGPKPGVEQSALCQECCRDHHDSGATNVARFDPERTSGTGKYDVNPQGALVSVSDMGNGDYVDACRVVRVDGFWRTASDIYERQHGLLPTRPVSGVEAKSGLPTTTAVTDYETFVKQYLAQIDGSQPYVTGAQTMFDAVASLNANDINITSPSNTDYRYLHARGLYVDYLEQKAREKIVDVLDDTDPQGLCPPGEEDECALPFLPFTTVNLTELTEWLEWPTTQTQIVTNERNLLSTTPAQPSGGRTVGIAQGHADARTDMRRSSSGIAVSSVLTTVQGVDLEDNGEVLAGQYDYSDQVLHDQQGFQVGAGGGPTFNVQVLGGGGNPFVFFTINTDDNVECLKPSTLHVCATSTGTVLPLPGTITVARYWALTTTSETMTNQPCTPRAATAVVARPTFTNYMVSAAQVVNGVTGTIAAPVNDISKDETTSIDFTAIPQGGNVQITLVAEGQPLKATIASCTTNGNGTQIKNIVWNESWAQP